MHSVQSTRVVWTTEIKVWCTGEVCRFWPSFRACDDPIGWHDFNSWLHPTVREKAWARLTPCRASTTWQAHSAIASIHFKPSTLVWTPFGQCRNSSSLTTLHSTSGTIFSVFLSLTVVYRSFTLFQSVLRFSIGITRVVQGDKGWQSRKCRGRLSRLPLCTNFVPFAAVAEGSVTVVL